MADLKERADKYALGKSNEMFDKAIAQAYIDGYKEGYKDCKADNSIKLHEIAPEFIDLGLPSGTLWASNFEMELDTCSYLPYSDALELNIPTKDQCNELFSSCSFKGDNGTICCIGPNGKTITLQPTGYKEIGSEDVPTTIWASFFWIKDTDKESDDNSASFGNSNGIWKDTRHMFTGYKLPVRLVKNK